MSGETVNVDNTAANEISIYIKKLFDEENLTPDLVFNVDETCLYWKKPPNHTFTAREERSAPGFKAAKDRLTLLLGGNASGTFRVKVFYFTIQKHHVL